MTINSQIVKAIIDRLAKIQDNAGDLSDIGNEIGIAIGKYTMNPESEKKGLDLPNFIDGLNHGVSLINKTH